MSILMETQNLILCKIIRSHTLYGCYISGQNNRILLTLGRKIKRLGPCIFLIDCRLLKETQNLICPFDS